MESKSIEELIVEERKAYFKEWRAKNKDKVKAQNDKYWRKRAESRMVVEQNKEV